MSRISPCSRGLRRVGLRREKSGSISAEVRELFATTTAGATATDDGGDGGGGDKDDEGPQRHSKNLETAAQ